MQNLVITTVRFSNFKALGNFSLALHDTNILVGPNNSGKSTIISAFRLLEVAIKTANFRRAEQVPSPNGGTTFGHVLSESGLPISLENVHTDYSETDSTIQFRFSNGNKLILYFPVDGGCILNWDVQGKIIRTTSSFKREFPFKVQVIPVLGPIEQDEKIITDDTVRRSLGTHRACRHFRNYWYKNPNGFADFKTMIEQTWTEMSIKPPEITGGMEPRIVMFCSENRLDREIYWSGFGFQIWCQLLTHLSRSQEYDLTVVDEPEVYLHPDVQRQLLGILRDLDVDVLLATHSSEILSEADPSEILLVNKKMRSAKRLKDIEGVQQALDQIGSVQNITLTHLARSRKILFTEGAIDFKNICRFAKKLGFLEIASGSEITAFESGGYSSWERVRSLAWGIEKTLNAEIKIAAIYDHDYWCSEEIERTLEELNSHLVFAHIHQRKEIENYLLVPSVIERISQILVDERNRRTGSNIQIDESICEVMDTISLQHKTSVQSQYLSKYTQYHKNSGNSADQATLTAEALRRFEVQWNDLNTRMVIVSGKKMLADLRSYLSKKYSITLTDIRIIDEFIEDEIPQDLKTLITRLEEFRKET